ncbi:ATP-binding protein [candidate division CSSED10-310 bacterium]|uniref:ATP-binding protein n=1 Tax=candidate division CSSED10-310 bacterium TaxID=2855610 RepID=A0ABV6YX40_UNCC1
MKIRMRRMSFPASLDKLHDMIDFIRQGAQKYGFDEDSIETIHLASEEILVNIISYAYPSTSGDINITYNFNKDEGFRIELIDKGIPFDPLALADPDLDAALEDRKDSGLGIYLVRKIMDKVEYKRDQGQNVLAFTKY